MKIKINDKNFLLRYIDTRFDEIETLIKNLPNLTFREYPYDITDKKNNVKYSVTRVDGGIQLSFTKDQLAFILVEDLIESLDMKLRLHLDFMAKFLRAQQLIPWTAIRFVEYAPTDLHIGMQFGNIIDCDFYISKIIGHSIMDKDAKFLHFSLFKVRYRTRPQDQQYPSMAIMKSPPLNLHVLTSLTEFGPFCSTFYNTFLPIQIFQQALTDYNSIIPSQNLTFIPNKEFGVFQFKHIPLSPILAVQVITKFVNNKLFIQLREATSFVSLMGYPKIDFHKYYEDFQQFVRSWEFEFTREINDFFWKFIVVSTVYIQFHDNIESKNLVYRILKRLQPERYVQKVLYVTTRYMTGFQQILASNPKREQMQDQRKLFELANIINNRYLHITSMMAYEDTDPKLCGYLKLYQDTMEKKINALKSQQIQLESEVIRLIESTKSKTFEQNDNSFIFRIPASQMEYRFCKNSIKKYVCNQETQEWTYTTFNDFDLKQQIQYM